MSGKRRWDERNYQTTWEDLEPWLQQLKEDHNVDVTFTVMIPIAPGGLRPAVVMEASVSQWPAKKREVKRDWKEVALRSVGHVERNALQMVSLLLLELENDKERAERQAPLL